MNTTSKMRDLTLKNMIILVSYIALLILGLIYLEELFDILGNIYNIIFPFILGFILAFVLNIPMKFFIKKLPIKNQKALKGISALLSILLLVLLVTLLVWVVLPQVIINVRSLINHLPQIYAQIQDWVHMFFDQVHLSNDIILRLEEFGENIGTNIFSHLTSWAPSIATGVSNVGTGLVNLFMAIVMAVYMILSKDKLLKQASRVGHAFLDDEKYDKVYDVLHLTRTTFENFLAGQLTESVIIGVLCYIGCVILDIPYGSIAAIVIAFTNIIPYFGPIIGAFISCIIILFVSPVKALVFLIFSTCLQQFESNLIYPYVVGNSVGLSALWVLFAVSVGGGLFGIPGMIFGLPAFSVIYELLRRLVNKRLKSKEELKIDHEES